MPSKKISELNNFHFNNFLPNTSTLVQLSFSDKEFFEENKTKFGNDTKIAHKRYGGICQALCGVISIIGYEEFIVQSSNHNPSAKLLKMIEVLALNGHVLELMNNDEKRNFAFYHRFPESKITDSEQQVLLLRKPDKTKTINPEMLKKVFGSMEDNHCMQLSFVMISEVRQFESGHSALIFKTKVNGETFYNFFDSNRGFFQATNIDDLIEPVNSTMKFHLTSDVGIIDIEKILLRNPDVRSMIKDYKREQNSGYSL